MTGCHTLDLATRQFTDAPDATPSVSAPVDQPTARAHGQVIEACAPDGGRCSTITARVDAVAATAVNADASRLVVIPATGPENELWDLDTLQRLATIELSSTDCRASADFVGGGDTVLLREASCPGATTGEGRLFDRLGRPLARVGGADFDATDAYAFPLSTTTWVFCNGEAIAVHDLASGAMITDATIARAGEQWDGIGLPVDSTTVAMIANNDLVGAVAIVDVATGIVTRFEPPRCE